eukprot:g4041.t1
MFDPEIGSPPASPSQDHSKKRRGSALPQTVRSFVKWMNPEELPGSPGRMNDDGILSPSWNKDHPKGSSRSHHVSHQFGGPPVPWRCFALTGAVLLVFGFLCWLLGCSYWGEDAADEVVVEGRAAAEDSVQATPRPRLGRPMLPVGLENDALLGKVRSEMAVLWQSASDPVTKISLLDGLWVMDMRTEWNEGRKALAPLPQFASNAKVGNDMIGDALTSAVSAYALSGHTFVFDLVAEYTGRALKLFKSDTGYPPLALSLRSGDRTLRKGAAPIAEVADLQMGFLSAGLLLHGESAPLSESWLRSLYALSGLVEKHGQMEGGFLPSLYEVTASTKSSEWRIFSVPSLGESSAKWLKFYPKSTTFDRLSFPYYDALLKGHMFLRDAWTTPAPNSRGDDGESKTVPQIWRSLFVRAMAAMRKERVKTGANGEMLLVDHKNVMPYDACPFAGLLALGAGQLRDLAEADEWLSTARGLAETCHNMFRSSCSVSATLDEKNQVTFQKATKDECANYDAPAESWYYLWEATGDARYRNWLREMVEKNDLRKTPKLLRFVYYAFLPSGTNVHDYVSRAVLNKAGQCLTPPARRGGSGRLFAGADNGVSDQRLPVPDSDGVDEVTPPMAATASLSTAADGTSTRTATDGPPTPLGSDKAGKDKPKLEYKVSGLMVRVGPSVFKKQRHRPWTSYPVEPSFAEGRTKFMSKKFLAATSTFLDEAEEWSRKKWDVNEIIDPAFIASLQKGGAARNGNGPRKPRVAKGNESRPRVSGRANAV